MNRKLLKLAKKNKAVDPASWEELYESKVTKKIRAKYSVNQELAILRQRDTKPDEFAAYNAYAEQCKAKPTAIIAKTVKGKGVSFMENQCSWHGAAPNKEQYEIAMAELTAQLQELEG